MRRPIPLPDASRNTEGRSPTRGRLGADFARAVTCVVRAVDVDASACFYLHGQRLRSMCRSKSPENTSGRFAAAPWRRAPARRRYCRDRGNWYAMPRISRSRGFPVPARSPPGGVPPTAGRSRQGVHQPQDSCAKKCWRLCSSPTGQVRSSSDDHGARSEPAAGFLHRREIHRDVEMLARRETRSMRRLAERARKRIAVAHAAGVFLENFPDRSCPSAAPTRRAVSLGR